MRSLLAASLGASLAVASLAAAGPAVEPLPTNTRALANDIAGKATGEQKAWAAEAGRRRPLPGYEALKAEVRSRFATHAHMSAFDVDRLAFLALVAGFDDGAAEHVRRSALVRIPTPTPTPSPLRRAKAHATATDPPGQGAELAMVNLQSLVSQRQMAVQIATSLIGRLDESSRTVAANIGR